MKHQVASDEQDYNNFMTWFDTQSKATESSIGLAASWQVGGCDALSSEEMLVKWHIAKRFSSGSA